MPIFPDFLADDLKNIAVDCCKLASDQHALFIKMPVDFIPVLSALKKYYEQLVDLTIVDMLHYGQSSWPISQVSYYGFNRATAADWEERSQQAFRGDRFHIIVILRSYLYNTLLIVSCPIPASLEIDSLTTLWPSANWYEREAYDLFGIVFRNHPDLRRLLTDYDFIGHPLRKDYPMMGYEELRYDHAQQRCVYEPHHQSQKMSIPKVIRPPVLRESKK